VVDPIYRFVAVLVNLFASLSEEIFASRRSSFTLTRSYLFASELPMPSWPRIS